MKVWLAKLIVWRSASDVYPIMPSTGKIKIVGSCIQMFRT